LLWLFVLLAGISAVAAEPAVDVKVLGEGLRGEIDAAYKTLERTGAIKNQGAGRNFITHVAVRYIPGGTPFEEAEGILRAAGFDIQPRTPNRFLPEPQKYDVRATIDQYASMPLGKTSVTVCLRPRSPNDYSVVQSLTAEITRSFP